jgi:hypothetical protein
MSDEVGELLQDRIDRQRLFVDQWRKPVEPLLFETLRAIDNVFCQELFYPPDAPERFPFPQYSLMTWGVNHALSRMIPDQLGFGGFKLFPSRKATQSPADEMLFNCGILQRAEMLHGWHSEGLLSARLDTPKRILPSGIEKIVVLKSAHPSLFCEVISRMHREWLSDLMLAFDGGWERDLERRHMEIFPELVRRVDRLGDWGIQYSSSKEIDDYFLEWGQVYLRRMWSQDLLGPDDRMGGSEFRDYLGVLAALGGRAQKHLCLAMILKRRYPQLDIRNLLTTFASHSELVSGLASHLDADTLLIQRLLSSLTLDSSNRDIHTSSPDTAWAPVVRATHDNYILPMYGLEINPFLFLLTDLQAKYPKDWAAAANNRERRWFTDLRSLFPPARWQVKENLKLRDGSKTVTDIDFIAYDTRFNELAVFQLKWQHPVGVDNRRRRSAGKNLVSGADAWITAVGAWIDKHGLDELVGRAGLSAKPGLRVHIFVIARYNAFFSGYAGKSGEAVWADWNHLMKARYETPEASVGELAATLRAQVAAIAASFPGESYAVPLFDVAVILNPKSEPPV